MQQPNRITQLIDISLIGITAAILFPLLQGRSLGVLLLCIAVIFLAFSRRMATKGLQDQAFTLMSWVLAGAMTLSAWTHYGLRDPSLLSYPAILLMISMVGKKHLMLGMVLFFSCSLTGLFLANHYGVVTHEVDPVNWETLAQTMVVLLISTLIIWAINSDYFQAYKNLQTSHDEVVASQAQIEFLAHHDSLTGLPTRTLARDKFEQMIATCARRNERCALLFLDLDNFKAINDSMGHRAGDQFLQRVADVLRLSVSSQDTVCRQSGDEFLILLNDIKSTSTVTDVIGSVLHGLHSPFEIDGISLSASCSIGVAFYPQDGITYDEIIKNADTAMYKAKESGRNGFCFFDQHEHSGVKQNIHLMSGLRNAIRNDELVLHYQPQFDLCTQKLIGVEALVRWNHPTEGMLPPLKFIHLAETSGLITELGQWVLNEACHQNARWVDQGMDLVMSVNLSPMQFRRDDLDKTISQALIDSGLSGNKLELELTENLFVDDTEKVCGMLARINSMGVLMSIDDFGTGYSNLSYLKRLPVQQLKIDQSFVRFMDHDNETLINVIIQMSENFKLISIAEGIEDEDTMLKLKSMGCQRGQGYFWDKPLSALDFESKYVAPRALSVA